MANAMDTVIVYDGSTEVNTPQALRGNGRNNCLVVSGMSNNGTLKFEASVDGSSFVEDESLQTDKDCIFTLENVPAIIRAVVTDVTDVTLIKVVLGY